MFVDSGDVRIATQTFGVPEGTPLLLIMGATASMLGWPDELCNILAEQGFLSFASTIVIPDAQQQCRLVRRHTRLRTWRRMSWP